MSVVRMRPPATGTLLEALLEAADIALRRRCYSVAFRTAVQDRLTRLLDGGRLRSGFVDYSGWPEYAMLDPDTRERIGPFIQRLGDAVSREAFTSLAVALLLSEVIAHVQTLTAAALQPPEPPGAA